jgi:hypothetical protein
MVKKGKSKTNPAMRGREERILVCPPPLRSTRVSGRFGGQSRALGNHAGDLGHVFGCEFRAAHLPAEGCGEAFVF